MIILFFYKEILLIIHQIYFELLKNISIIKN